MHHFSAVYFDTYKDDFLLVNFLDKLHCTLSDESNSFMGSLLFDVADIEASVKCLNNGKACGPVA